ncbi:MAG TPA: C-type lectin domain-containing protein [Polyangiaceae bacterium]
MRARLFLLTSSLSFVTVGLACLPDLVLSPVDADADAAQTSPCGDGVVDLDAEQCDPGAGDAGFGCTATCTIDCEGGAVDPTTNHCYFWATTTDTIDHAELYCTLAGGNAHVVSFADQDELTFVGPGTKSLPNAPDGGGGSWTWLEKSGVPNEAGLDTYYVPDSEGRFPGWAASCPGCYANADGGDAGDFAYAAQNPQFCVFWKKTPLQGWVQQVCTFTGNTVTPLCEREPPGSFSAPCADDGGDTCIRVPRTATTKRYELTATASSFDNARIACAARGGILARFESGAEREQVVAELVRVLGFGGDVWIGLAYDGDAGAWIWDDGTPAAPVFPTPWADGEPSVAQGAATIHWELGRFDTRLAIVQPDTTATFRALCQIE